MYRLIEQDDLNVVDVHAQAADLYKAAWTGDDSVVFITDQKKLVGYVNRDSLAKRYSSTMLTADYLLDIRSFAVPDDVPRDDMISIHRASHSALSGLFMRFRNLRIVPITDQAGHLLAAARRIVVPMRIESMSEANKMEDYLRCHQTGQASLVGQYLHEVRRAKTVAVWCDGGTLPEAVIRDLLESDVRVSHIISDYSYIQAGEITSIGSDRFSEVDADLAIVVGGTKSIPDALRKRKPGLAVLAFWDLVALTIKWAYGTKALVDQAQRLSRQGVTMRVFCSPTLARVRNPSEREKEIIADPRSVLGRLLSSDRSRWAHRLEPVRSDRHTLEEYVSLVVDCPPSAIPRNGYTINSDTDNKYFHYRDGRRAVVGAPTIFRNTVWIVGDSSSTNYYGDDSQTIASYLQQALNERFGDEFYRVVDMGCNGQRKDQTVRLIDDLELVPGDKVFLIAGNNLGWEFPEVAKRGGVLFDDLTHLLDRPHNHGEVFIWSGLNHVNHKGQKIIAEELARIGFDDAFAPQRPSTEAAPEVRHEVLILDQPPIQVTPEFRAYLAFLDDNKADCEGRIGSIVVNCNPFTLGHRYLVETSASKCDFLYVFVVEEDKSIFPFADRIELVRQGTADLANVRVLPSGKFIISSLTFPDYFSKGENPTAVVDPTQDVALFAKHIARQLGITVRFAGEEPLDLVTRQYNATMARVLPANGVEFDVIARKEQSGAPISASRVLALLADQDFAAIAELVPPTTLAYLRTRPIQ